MVRLVWVSVGGGLLTGVLGATPLGGVLALATGVTAMVLVGQVIASLHHAARLPAELPGRDLLLLGTCFTASSVVASFELQVHSLSGLFGHGALYGAYGIGEKIAPMCAVSFAGYLLVLIGFGRLAGGVGLPTTARRAWEAIGLVAITWVVLGCAGFILVLGIAGGRSGGGEAPLALAVIGALFAVALGILALLKYLRVLRDLALRLSPYSSDDIDAIGG
jgi:hypothetical protein